MSDINVDGAFNNRDHIASSSVVELMSSIETQGLIQPIVVRYFINDEETFGKKYDLVAGFRRYKAISMLDDPLVKAVIKDGLTKNEALFLNVSENINRKQLSIQEESEALMKIIELNPADTEKTICRKLSITRGWLQPRLMLGKLPDAVKELAHEGWIGALSIRDLHSFIDDPKALVAEIKRIKEKAGNAKALGKTPTIIKVKTIKKDNGRNPAATPQKRSKKETDAVIDYLCDYGFQGRMFIKSLAWSSGNISDLEFCAEIKQYGENPDEPILFEFDTSGFTDVLNSTV